MMKHRSSRLYIAALSAASLLCIASGIAHGWLDGRWIDRVDVNSIGAQLQQLPQRFGDWSLAETQELPESARKMLQCYGDTLKVYQSAKTGNRVTVAVLFGPRGPIAVHTPEICYSGQGIQQQGNTQRVTLDADGLSHSLWKVIFQSKVDSQPALEAYYAWSVGDAWQAAEHPRVWLTDRLYKIQVAGQPALPGQISESQQFLEQFLPQLQPLLVKTTRT
jgi:hypothetical protein